MSLTDPLVALALVPVNEPVFILRASDPHAAELVTRWAELTLASSGDPVLARVGFDQAHAMRMWRRRQASQEPPGAPIAGPGASEAGK